MAEAAEYLEPETMADPSLARGGDLIVPRITIEAFCVTPEFAAAMQTAAQDRRMAKAKTSVGMGGAASAAKRYANLSAPNLIVVETKAVGFAVFDELETLASVCGEDTRVIVAGPSNDVTLYRELIRQGVSEYLVTPTAPLQIIEAVAGAYEDPEATPAGKLVAVYGVRGGVGASVLCHNLAELASSRVGRETILIDLDLEFGTLGLDFNAETKNSVADALGDISALDDVKLVRLLHQQQEQLRLLTAPGGVQPRAPVGEDEVLGLMDVVRYAADLVFLDLPQSWSDGVRTALRQADEVVLVAAPDLVSLRNLKSVHDWLQAERKHDVAPKIVLNQVGEAKRPEIGAGEFAEIIGAPADATLPYEPALFGAAQTDGKPLSALPAAKKLVDKLEEVACALAGATPKAPKKASGLAAWLGLS